MARRAGKKFGKKKVHREQKNSNDSSNSSAKPQGFAPYADTIKENPAFEAYYRAQKFVSSDEEFQQMMAALRRPLPAAFRINSICFGQSQALKNLVESPEFGNLLRKPALEDADDKSNASLTDESRLIPLPWYPSGLAYQMKLSRTEIRREEQLRKLHNFLVNESENGYISRQEAVSMIPPLVLDVQQGHKVLDMCAAPGSKTGQIIELLHAEANENMPTQNTMIDGLVVANDVDNSRCYMLVHQAKRLNSPSFVITNHDAGAIPNFYMQTDDGQRQKVKFDRIVCDVPCSGDGTMRKNIDIWKIWTIGNGNSFHGMQSRIAKRGAELLAKDGLMVYSTCSFNPMEDEAVVANLLCQAKGSLELVDVSMKLQVLKYLPGVEHWTVMAKDQTIISCAEQVPENLQTQIRPSMFPPANAKELHLNRCVRVLPHLQDTGGFFIALIRKTTDRLPWESSKETIKVKQSDNASNGDSTTGANSNGIQKRPNEADAELEEPKQKKPKFESKRTGWKENPFNFVQADDPDWPIIREYYGINEDFPYTQLMHRAEKKSGNLYFMTNLAKNVITGSNDGSIKFINGGVRMFCRIQEKVATCPFRLTQDGVSLIYPYMNKQKIIDVTGDEFRMILEANEFVDNEQLSAKTQEVLDKLPTGSCIIQLNKTVISDGGNEMPLIMPILGWKGKNTLRPYICKKERLHYMRLCGFDLSEYEKEQKKLFDERQQRKKERQNATELQNSQQSQNKDSTENTHNEHAS